MSCIGIIYIIIVHCTVTRLLLSNKVSIEFIEMLIV